MGISLIQSTKKGRRKFILINNIMKSTNLLTITALALSLLTASCDKNQPMETDEDTVNVSFVYYYCPLKLFDSTKN